MRAKNRNEKGGLSEIAKIRKESEILGILNFKKEKKFLIRVLIN